MEKVGAADETLPPAAFLAGLGSVVTFWAAEERFPLSFPGVASVILRNTTLSDDRLGLGLLGVAFGSALRRAASGDLVASGGYVGFGLGANRLTRALHPSSGAALVR